MRNSKRYLGQALAVFLLGLSLAGVTEAAPVALSHPLLGTWKWITPKEGCAETYNFRADGKLFFTSGDEAGEGVYTVSAEPSANGYYKIMNDVAADNAKKDCLGNISPPSHWVLFAHFNPADDRIQFCHNESADSCFGPLRRK